MSDEVKIVQPALRWVATGIVPAVGVAYLVRGRNGAISLLIATALVIANAVAAAGLSMWAGRLHGLASGFVALPSFAFRMAGILAVLIALKGASFIDKPTFAISFAVTLTIVMFLEAKSFKNTPWLVRAFSKTDGVKS